MDTVKIFMTKIYIILAIQFTKLKQMKKIAKMHRGFVEQAGFVVLKNPDIPSLLIETGFITNAEEARKLSTPAYRSQMAQAIFSGVDSHFRAKPPMDTALAAARGGKVKRVIDKTPLLDAVGNEESEAARQVSAKSVPAFSEGNRAKKKLEPQADAMAALLAEKKEIKKTVAKKKIAVLKESTIKTKPSVTHVVKKGETLSGIAARYKVSASAVSEANKLRNQNVMLGQKLKIPQ